MNASPADLQGLPPVLDVPADARALGIGRGRGRGLAYRLVANGDIPALRLGRLVRVRRADLLHLLGLEDRP